MNDDNLLHGKELLALHTQAAERNKEITDPKEGFAAEGICAGCVVDMAAKVHETAAREIGVREPKGPAVLPIAMQVYAYGIYLGMEIERAKRR